MKKLLLPLLAFTLVLGSCKKYEEGPTISFRSKKARIAGDWKITKSVVDGKEETLDADDKDDVLTFDKDGTYELTDPGNPTEKGKWAFDSKKEAITVTESTSGFAIVYTILKLKNKELWIEADVLGSKYVQHYEQE